MTSSGGWAGLAGQAEDRTLTSANVPAAMLPYAPGGTTVTPNSALQLADVWACVRVLSDAAASVPLIAYRRTENGRQRATGALADLLRLPAPATTQSALMGQLMAHLQLYGNGWLGKWKDIEGRVEQLALLHPERVTVELRAGRPVYTILDGRGGRSEHGTDDVLHIRAPLSVDGLTGLSPIRQCRVALGLAGNLAEHANEFFAAGGRPDGILKAGVGGQEALKALRETWHTSRQRNRGRGIAVVGGDVEFVPVSGPLDDLQFVEQRAMSTSEIARIFKVPPYLVGAAVSGDSMTYSSTEMQSLNFVVHSLRPWLVAIEQAITNDTDLCRGSLYVEYLLDALLRADSKTRADVYALALDPDRGWLTRAEVRRLENLDPEDDQ